MVGNGGMYRRRRMNFKDKKIYDISMPITKDMPVWKGIEANRPQITVDSDFSTGVVYSSSIKTNMHNGTHIDRTLHMMEGGNTVETLPLQDYITECKVLDLTEVKDRITDLDLRTKDIKAGDFILLKTRNSFEDILEGDFVFVHKSAASYLADIGIKGLGIDALGIERSQPEHDSHLSLMGKGVHILEGLRLAEIEEGEYLLIALPLLIVGAEAAPARAVLVK
jgi:arylformamidase